MTDDVDNTTRLANELEKGLIPFGKLTTYGSVGKLLGINPREVGLACRTLGQQPETKDLPYHRIINQFGRVPRRFSAGGRPRHIKLLESEGHTVQKVDKDYLVLDYTDFLEKS
ncbi:MAG: MGMT family protein [Promethearchaeota archaeon]